MSAAAVPGNDSDALFQLPLGEFTAARNALAAQLKKEGRQPEANAVKALVKPSVSAWVVNQLYWRHREAFDRLLDAGDRLRRAQRSQLTSEAGREAVNARRDAVTALAAIAADLLRDGDHGATRDLLRRVTSTLEALSTHASLPDAPAAGRLTDDVEPPGFEALAGLVSGNHKNRASVRTPAAPVPKPPQRVDARATAQHAEAERKAELAAAKAAVRDAEAALKVARKQVERANAKRDATATRMQALEEQRAELEAQLARATKEAKAARDAEGEATAHARGATVTAEAAERALEAARRRLQQLANDRA